MPENTNKHFYIFRGLGLLLLGISLGFTILVKFRGAALLAQGAALLTRGASLQSRKYNEKCDVFWFSLERTTLCMNKQTTQPPR